MRKLFLLLILMLQTILLTSTICSATDGVSTVPALFYTDLTSGPNSGGQDNKGTIVTIYGRNFGASQGSSSITCGGGAVDNYKIWYDTQVAFQLGSSAATGNIVLTTTAGTSNALVFTVRAGNIYFAKTTGNDTTGNGSWDTPWLTIKKLKNGLTTAGDIGYVCDGITETTADDEGVVNCNTLNGTAASPIALVAYPGATVQIGGDANARVICAWWSGHGTTTQYWVIAGFHIRGTERLIQAPTGWRMVCNYLTAPNGDSGGGSAGIEGSGSNIYILGNDFNNVGKASASKLYHNIYIDNVCDNVEIGWNTIHDSTANRGIQFYSTDAYLQNVRIHDNLLYNLNGNAINISAHTTGSFYIYNNIIYKCGLDGDFYDGISSYAGIYVSGGNATIYLYNNTIYDCGAAAGANYNSALLSIIQSLATVHVKNNIFIANGQSYEPFIDKTSGTYLPVTEAGYNVFYGTTTDHSYDTTNITFDPGCTSPDSGNFILLTTSTIRDIGLSTTEITDVAPKDYFGISRPQNDIIDPGAIEYFTGETGSITNKLIYQGIWYGGSF